MKNTWLLLLFVFISGHLCHFGLPWWALVPLSALAGWLFPQAAWRSVLAGFAGGLLLWTTNALWLDIANAGLLSGKVGTLFMGLSRSQILLFTGLLGGLLGGLGALTGRWARDVFGKSPN
ncbi:MAG: hypothetical protein IPH12_05860 [Saprospirales bacterium]|nr:hypothetical protein [Saprospirales bacterium]MBK8923124.1 hypothetical protein [Saprospirales bacterium]